MANLNFIFGPMGSSKTAQALMQRYNLMENGKNVLFLKSSIDTRDGENIIRSRIGIEAPVVEYSKDDNLINLFTNNATKFDCVIIDEVELSTTIQVEQLKYIAEELNVPIYAYGLRTDFKSHLFPGSKRLFELADVITQMESICPCGEKAIINARYKKGRVIYNGPKIVIGGNDKYMGLCYSCYKKGKIN